MNNPPDHKNDDVKTVRTDTGPDGADDDVESDPGQGAARRTDWSDEGGATSAGPATESEQ